MTTEQHGEAVDPLKWCQTSGDEQVEVGSSALYNLLKMFGPITRPPDKLIAGFEMPSRTFWSKSSLTMGWFLMFFALLANFTVERVSTMLSSAGLIIAIIVVLQFPPRLFGCVVVGVCVVGDGGFDNVEVEIPQPCHYARRTRTP